MKKVKTLLVSAIAALSLSACSLQDAIDWTKEAGGTVSGFFTSLLEKVGLKKPDENKEEKKEESCNHEDKNHDGTCDLCGATGLEVVHSDENHDHACDVCGAVVSQHSDADNDFKCDECGADLAIVDVRLDTSAAQLDFSKGEQFSAAGVKVIATSEAGSEKELEFTVSDVDTSTVGEKTVVVTYGTGENDKFEYKIQVEYWSSSDLKAFQYGSLSGSAPLPYLPGFNMRVEARWEGEGDDEELLEWKIVADGITAEAYLDYCNRLSNYYAEVQLQLKTTFELQEIAGDFEGFHGLSDVSVFALAPTAVYQGQTVRYYTSDEYFVLGINQEGQLVIESRLIDASLDGYFLGTFFANGERYFPAPYGYYVEYAGDILENYHSELSYDAWVYPDVSQNANASFTPYNLKSVYPTEEAYDQFDLAWFLEVDGGTQAEYDAFIADLLAHVYEKVEGEKRDSYIIDDPLLGYIEYVPAFYAEEETEEGTTPSAICFNFYYINPGSYTNHLDYVAMSLEQELGLEFNILNDYYEDFEVVVALGEIAQGEFADGEEAAISLARQMLDLGFDITEEIAYGSKYDDYEFEMSNGYYDLSFYVDAVASEGSFGLEIDIADSEGLEISNAEMALQVTFESFSGHKALKGVDYAENADGTFGVSLVVAKDATEAALQAGAEGIGSYLPASFELASSEAGENGTWVAIFNDVANNVQVVSVSSLDGDANLICSATFENHRFVTPETTMVEFLTAHNGAAPAASDYEVAQDGSCSALIAFSGEHAAADLQGLAEGLGEELGEAFEKVSSEADGEDWVAVYDNEDTGIRVTIIASLEDSTASALVETSLIPEPVVVTAAEVYLRAVLANFGMNDPVIGDDYYQYGDNEYFYTSFAVAQATGEENLQELCEYYCGAAPEDFTLLYSSEASTQSYYQVDSWTVTLLTSDYSYVAVFEIFVVQGLVVLAVDIFANN